MLMSLALIIILLKAGLSLNLEDLKKVGHPAVVVPRMVRLIETKYGTGKTIPQMILSAAVMAIIITAPLGAFGMDMLNNFWRKTRI